MGLSVISSSKAGGARGLDRSVLLGKDGLDGSSGCSGAADGISGLCGAPELCRGTAGDEELGWENGCEMPSMLRLKPSSSTLTRLAFWSANKAAAYWGGVTYCAPRRRSFKRSARPSRPGLVSLMTTGGKLENHKPVAMVLECAKSASLDDYHSTSVEDMLPGVAVVTATLADAHVID